MSPLMRKGLWVAILHVAIVASVGAKFAIDRATRPRVWARAAPFDPNLPIRGRYVRLQLEAAIGEGLTLPAPQPIASRPGGTTWTPPPSTKAVSLIVRNGELVAMPAPQADALTVLTARLSQPSGEPRAVIDQPVAYFIPEHVADPSRRAPGEELWVEVTIPARGVPRPIRLGVKKDGVLTALDVK